MVVVVVVVATRQGLVGAVVDWAGNVVGARFVCCWVLPLDVVVVVVDVVGEVGVVAGVVPCLLLVRCCCCRLAATSTGCCARLFGMPSLLGRSLW